MLKIFFLSIALVSEGAHLFKKWFNSDRRFLSYDGKRENSFILRVNSCWNNKNGKNLQGGMSVLTVSTLPSCLLPISSPHINTLGVSHTLVTLGVLTRTRNYQKYLWNNSILLSLFAKWLITCCSTPKLAPKNHFHHHQLAQSQTRGWITHWWPQGSPSKTI